MDRECRQRLGWVELYVETGDAGLTCRRCGISRPTLRKWVKRYQAEGETGLRSRSRRPRTSPGQKVFGEQVSWILELRQQRHLGVRRIQSELLRLHHFKLFLSTIHHILKQQNSRPLRLPKRTKEGHRYTRPVPGDRVQVDTIKIAPGIYQYTAIDDCTRWLEAALYSRRTAEHACEFLEDVIHAMPFPVQRIQTDRGTEFTASAVQELLFYLRTKWRPIPPRSPHLKGKVERVQKTILQEFYATVDPQQIDLETLDRQLSDWIWHYNHERIHGVLGTSPIERLKELDAAVPKWETVDDQFDVVHEYLHLRRLGIFIYIGE